MFAKQQIFTTSLIIVGLTSAVAFQANAQNQFNLGQSAQTTSIQKPLLTAQASPLITYGSAAQLGTQQVAGGTVATQVVNPQFANAQYGVQYAAPQAVGVQYGYQVAAPVAIAGYTTTGGQVATGQVVSGQAVSGGQLVGSQLVGNQAAFAQNNGGAYQVAAPAAAYSYALQQPAQGYAQVQYAQPSAQYAFSRVQYAQPQVRYAYTQPTVRYAYAQQYAQPAVRYGYVQQQAVPQQVAAVGAAGYYQSYSASVRPTLPQPTVITKTYKSATVPSVTTTTQTSAYAKTNAVPYDECVAGCEEACSENKSFLSHCVRACGDLVKVIGKNQSYAVDWKNAGSQAGRAVIAAHTGQ